ncbi:sugar phosphate isomerase/epimerase [Parapedobacter defluvii]|uniref:sugar phosphate isomerase/epimerase family protein n=1 Tax=Parapedobacter defluvii TaxID=2045106 RepID=UPI0033400207
MKKQLRLMTMMGLVVLAAGITMSYAQQPEKKLGWHLSAQTYTFNRFTFFEAVDKTLQAGLNSVEAYPGQELGGGLEGVMDYNMDAAQRKAILRALKKKKVKLCAFGVVNGNTEEEWKQIFEFAKAMGVKVINSEPDEKFMPLIGQLANQYKIKFGIHNHPQPSHYWDPKVVLAAVAKANSPYVGGCADIGHWVRSGLDPLECLKQYEGHLVSLHFKDLSEKSREGHDVHWGTGVCNVEGVIAELKRQGFKGNISAEYEHNWENNVGDVAESAKNFRAILTK